MTTIVLVRKNNEVVVAGDGQVSMGNTVVKSTASKVRKIEKRDVVAGFAGSTADALTLFERLEAKIEKHAGRSLKGSFFIGDKESDWICAENFGCTPLLVKTGYGKKTISSMVTVPKERVFKNLFTAVEYILS